MPRRASIHDKRDANQAAIVTECRQRGIEVIEIGMPVDLIVVRGRFVGFVEIKVPGNKASIQQSQVAFMAMTAAPVAFAESADDILRFINTGIGISQSQKNTLAGLLYTNPHKRAFTKKQVAEVIGKGDR